MSDDTTGVERPYDGWTDAQWRDWFIREVESTDVWPWLRAKANKDGPAAYLAGLKLPQLPPLSHTLLDVARKIAWEKSGDFGSDLTTNDALRFWSATEDVKARFFEAWTAHHAQQSDREARAQEPDPSGEAAALPVEPASNPPIEPALPPIGSYPGYADETILDEDVDVDSLDWGNETPEVNITLPGGNVAVVPDGDVDETRISVPPTLEERRNTKRELLEWIKGHWPLAVGAGVGLGAIGAIAAISITAGGGGDSTDTDAAALPSTPVVTEADTGEGTANTTLLTPIAPATTAPADACAVAAQQDFDMQFSSVDVIDGIDEEFSQRAGAETGYQTPAFSWSGIPPAATELVIVMQWVPENRRDEIVTATNLWEETEPPGSSRWVLRGIDPTSDGIRRTNLDTGLPEGTQEIDHTGGIVQIGGEPAMNKFLGPDAPERTYMFTLLALCDPELGTPFDESLGWFRRYAIATTWFFADAEF